MRLQYDCMSHPGATLESFMEPHRVLNGNEWVTQVLSIGGEAGIWPPEHTMEDRLLSLDWRTPDHEREWGIEDLRQSEDLASLFEIAGDGDGHRYYLSAASRQFYVWWHFGPERVEPCNLEGEQFIDWLVEQYPEQPQGRPWTTFKPSGRFGFFDVTGFSYAHSTRFPLADIEAIASPLFRHPKIYRTGSSYSAIDPAIPLLIEAFHDHRGYYTELNLQVCRAAASDVDLVAATLAFQKAVLELGFCHPDSPELVRAC